MKRVKPFSSRAPHFALVVGGVRDAECLEALRDHDASNTPAIKKVWHAQKIPG